MKSLQEMKDEITALIKSDAHAIQIADALTIGVSSATLRNKLTIHALEQLRLHTIRLEKIYPTTLTKEQLKI